MVNSTEENAHIESFHGTFKKTAVYQKHDRSINHCKNSFAKFIDKYNNSGPHSAIGKIPAAVYHKKF